MRRELLTSTNVSNTWCTLHDRNLMSTLCECNRSSETSQAATYDYDMLLSFISPLLAFSESLLSLLNIERVMDLIT
jgi:hypothetical protein